MGAKEIAWWSGPAISDNDIYDYERYLDLADIAADEVFGNLQMDGEPGDDVIHPMIFGDGTPSTLFSNVQWRKYTINHKNDPNATHLLTPRIMSHVQPKAKLIVILRDPVAMTFSSYKFFHKFIRNMSVEHFDHCVMVTVRGMVDCAARYSEEDCAFEQFSEFRLRGSDLQCNFVLRSLQLGRYYIFLQEWLKYFPLDQLYAIRLEDYAKTRRNKIEDIWKWLGVPILQPEKRKNKLGERNVNSGSTAIGDMHQSTRKVLGAFFHSANIKLANLLKTGEFNWQQT